jgi:alpha-glucosidase
LQDKEWLAARQNPTRDRLAVEKKNVFQGRTLFEHAQVAGTHIIRMRVSSQADRAFPTSFAVLNFQDGKKPERTADWEGFQDVDWGEDEPDDEERRKPVPPEVVPEEPTPIWEALDSVDLPLNLEWVQALESRFELTFDLAPEARCWGLGERQSGLNLRGRHHTLFNTDDYTHVESIDSMYKSIPFLVIEHHGQYQGLFLDSPARQKWSLDEDLNGKAHIELLSRRGWDLYFFGPCSLPTLISAYTTLTGRSFLPPRWALGHQQSRWSYPDEETVVKIAHEFRTRKIPCDVMVLDIDYMEDYRVFTHSKERFPSFANLISDLQLNGFRVVTIVDPGVKQDEDYFAYVDGLKHDYFCNTADGEVFIGKVWPGLSAFPDFLKEDVRRWWAALHGFYTDNGVGGIWNDMNEPSIFEQQTPLAKDVGELPEESDQLFMQTTPDGKAGHFEVRNLYGMLMSRATCEGLRALRPDERPFVLSRSSYAGQQRYSAVWLGDNMSWWGHLESSIPMIINMGLSGVPFSGVDIGGFNHDCTAELLVRWYETGIFYPFFRNHCSLYGRPQEPWVFGEDVEKLIRNLIEWRYKLLPYIQALFYEHMRAGAPLLRPLAWHYPNDKIAVEIDDQFMFGDKILVAPITVRGRTMRSVYLPEGLWHPLAGGPPLAGGRTHQQTWPLGSLPAFVRDGVILPLADIMQNTGEYENVTIVFHCFGDKCEGEFFDDDGISPNYLGGDYNEWILKVDSGHLKAQPRSLGYTGSHRRYGLVWQGHYSTVELDL